LGPVNSTSSKLIQLPALAVELRLTVQAPAVTVPVTDTCTHVLVEVCGIVVRGSGFAPQLRSAMYAALCPPLERTHTRAV
jgi:hypothetical protein